MDVAGLVLGILSLVGVVLCLSALGNTLKQLEKERELRLNLAKQHEALVAACQQAFGNLTNLVQNISAGLEGKQPPRKHPLGKVVFPFPQKEKRDEPPKDSA